VQVGNLLVTGGAGFIGSNFVNQRLSKRIENERIFVIDALTYASNFSYLVKNENLTFIKGDIRDKSLIDGVMSKIDSVVNFAAESHVDRSINDSEIFISTNVLGTQVLLESALKFGIKRFVQISTDEVYGSILDGAAKENFVLCPNSPYAASKAASELISYSYYKTYGLNVMVTRSSNNYGPNQHTEKLLPLVINSIRRKQNIPVYGNGLNRRDWIHVVDNCTAIELILEQGVAGEVYNIGGNNELSNLELIYKILEIMGGSHKLITFVKDRKGHDFRYSIDSGKILNSLSFAPKVNLTEGLIDTVQWYLKN
jgi:dTDP-glucose 4,6-dehydratase